MFQSIIRLQKLLDTANIPSIVIGGIAVGTWGEPRLTRDVDIKILLTREKSSILLSLLGKEYISLLPDPMEALQKQAMVFIQDETGTRIDLLLGETIFDKKAIKRGRYVETQPGIIIRMCTPEDLIIYKLISARPRDFEDAKSVVRRQGSELDEKYILSWLRQFEQALDDSTLVRTFRTLKEGQT